MGSIPYILINSCPSPPLPYHSISSSSFHSSSSTALFISRSSFKSIKATRSESISANKEVHKKEKTMTITPSIKISGGDLLVRGKTVVSNVPPNITTTSAATSSPVDGIFVGATLSQHSNRHVITLGTLRGHRFLAIFRFKLWWMSQKMGENAGEIPLETQFLIVESKEEDEISYIVFLPLISGPFRACLQGSKNDFLELCIESGDEDVKTDSFTNFLFIGVSVSDPFKAVSDAVNAVKSKLKTFRQRAEKKLPKIVDYFGWCTWDAFYQKVDQEGVEAGLKSLTSIGVPPKFVIIDDGWQSTASDIGSASGSLERLTGIRENDKFRNEKEPKSGIESIVNLAKEKYGLTHVYVWHAITGYWGGVRPGIYGSKMQYPNVSQTVQENEPGMKTDVLTLQGLGVMDPKNVHAFYDEMHSYLAKCGVDGVKVDVQCVLETLGGGHGGRVELTRQYHQALDASIAKNFPDNGCIACMSHNTDALYCSKQTSLIRASDDFYPRDPVSHTIHIASVAYNSVFLGEFMLPDWDMFHSLHPAAEYHASARALSGGPVYVSDAPGKHNAELLRKLVLPDGSILRARLPGRPTRDCLFTDPTRDGVSLLKIWNMNKFTGILGVYNCQGAAWSSTEKKNTFHETGTDALSCQVIGSDVHLITEAATDSSWNGDCALFSHKGREVVVLPHKAVLPVSLKVLEHEIFTITPIKDLGPGLRFAPLGLIDMYNSGGAIENLSYKLHTDTNTVSFSSRSNSVATVFIEVKGCGRFGAYSSVIPKRCSLGSKDCEFLHDTYGLLTIGIEEMPKEDRKIHELIIEF